MFRALWGSVFSPEMDSTSAADNVIIRIFEKILRTHEVTSTLVKVDENFRLSNSTDSMTFLSNYRGNIMLSGTSVCFLFKVSPNLSFGEGAPLF